MLEDIKRALRRDSSAAVSRSALASSRFGSMSSETNGSGDPARAELIQRFAGELTRIGGRFQRCADENAAFEYIVEIAAGRKSKLVVSWDVPLLPGIDLH